MQTKGTIVAKAGNGKAAKLSDDNWYNFDVASAKYLANFNKGDEVVVEFEKKGATSRIVSKITAAAEAVATPVEAPKQEAASSEFKCKVCGKAMKDGKYDMCYTCNQKNPKEKKSQKSYYDSPEKQASIQRGNALNAAAAVAAGQNFDGPDAVKQFTLILADDFLTWLRAE